MITDRFQFNERIAPSASITFHIAIPSSAEKIRHTAVRSAANSLIIVCN